MFKKATQAASMMKTIANLQTQMMDAQKAIAAAEFEGTSVNGLVKVVITGTGEIVRTTISPALLEGNDAELIADAFSAAVNNAIRVKDTAAKAKLAEVTKNSLPNIPGLDLSSILGAVKG